MLELRQHPPWLKKSIPVDSRINATRGILKELGVNTVCQSARCPNIFECFSKKWATFLILGSFCTRRCGFCSVGKQQPGAPDIYEPEKTAEAAFLLGLSHVIITSVTRDDLADGGSGHFVKTINAVRKRFNGKVTIEVLVPDFKGDKASIKKVARRQPDIFGHNVETVPRLYKEIRPQADYRRSLGVLKFVKECNPGMTTKSSLMLGLGESEKEVVSVMEDLRGINCDMLAIGQYLRPFREQVEVKEFVRPQKFLRFKEIGYSLGFKDVQSGPFVRSSYKEEL